MCVRTCACVLYYMCVRVHPHVIECTHVRAYTSDCMKITCTYTCNMHLRLVTITFTMREDPTGKSTRGYYTSAATNTSKETENLRNDHFHGNWVTTHTRGVGEASINTHLTHTGTGMES